MKIAFIYNEHYYLGRFTKFFTGCYCYHIGFVDIESDMMYDMDFFRRRRQWSEYSKTRQYVLVDAPVDVSVDFLEEKLTTDNNSYSYLDVFLFTLRPIYHLFGKSTRNANGIICSEMIANDLKENGWDVTFEEVPSPCDLNYILGANIKSSVAPV